MSHDLVIYRSNSASACCSAKLRIELRHVRDLRFDPRNPRQHPPKQIVQIAASIRAFGFLVPVLSTRTTTSLQDMAESLLAKGWARARCPPSGSTT
jgi:hypothetical protein